MSDPWSAGRPRPPSEAPAGPRAGPAPAPTTDLPAARPGMAPGVTRPGWGGGHRHHRRLSLRGALVLLVVWLLISGLGFWPAQAGGLGLAPVPQALAAVFLLVCIGIYRWSDTAMGLSFAGPRHLLWLPLLYLPTFATMIVVTGAPGIDMILSVALAMMWLALSEELMFRGLLFPALRGRMGIWPAIWLTTVLFGIVHVMNVAGTGSLIGAIVQSVAATSTGLLLLAIRLRRGSIWPAVVYHLAWNVCVIVLDIALQGRGVGSEASTNPAMAVLVPLAMVAPNGLYGLWLMRHAGRKRLPGDPGRITPTDTRDGHDALGMDNGSDPSMGPPR